MPTTALARPPRARAVTLGSALAALLVLASARPAAAHERWFVEDTAGGDWGFLFSPLPLALVAAVVVVALAWRWVAFRLPTPEIPQLQRLGRLAPYIPRLLAIHLGVSLLALAVTGSFLAPSLPLEDVPGGTLAGLLEAALGVWFVTGVRLRPAAVALAGFGPLVLLAAGPVAVLEAAALLGVALFVAILPPSDGTFGRVTPSARTLRHALLALRVGVAVALVTLALSEKLTNPALARATLETYPQLDVFALVGLDVPPDVFVAIAGAVELLFGLLVLSGALPQVAVLVAAVPFNATIAIFGTTETVGHLPVYGVFLTLLVYGSNPATAGAVRWLPTRRRTTVPQSAPEPAPVPMPEPAQQRVPRQAVAGDAEIGTPAEA